MPRSLVLSYVLTMAAAVVMGCVGLAIATLIPTTQSIFHYAMMLTLVTGAFMTNMRASDLRVKVASCFFMIGLFSAGHALLAFAVFALIVAISVASYGKSPLRQQLATNSIR